MKREIDFEEGRQQKRISHKDKSQGAEWNADALGKLQGGGEGFPSTLDQLRPQADDTGVKREGYPDAQRRPGKYSPVPLYL